LAYFKTTLGAALSLDNSYAIVTQEGAVRKVTLSTFQVTLLAGYHTATGYANGFGTNARFGTLGQITGHPTDDSLVLLAESSYNEIKGLTVGGIPTKSPTRVPKAQSSAPLIAPCSLPSLLPSVAPTVSPSVCPSSSPLFAMARCWR
jgi:hypothetical protein